MLEQQWPNDRSTQLMCDQRLIPSTHTNIYIFFWVFCFLLGFFHEKCWMLIYLVMTSGKCVMKYVYLVNVGEKCEHKNWNI